MPFYSPIQIRFRDLDALNHVNNAVYFSYVEQARVEYFDHVIGTRHDWQAFTMLLVRNEINYRMPLLFKQEAGCTMAIEKIGTSSIHIRFEIIRNLEGSEKEIIADGKNILVCFDNVKQKKAPGSSSGAHGSWYGQPLPAHARASYYH